MNAQEVVHDERTVAVVNASYRWSYLVMSFGLLAIAAYRSMVYHEAVWDLLVLVMLGGAVGAAYQQSQRILYRRWLFAAFATFAIAAVIAIVILLLRGVK